MEIVYQIRNIENNDWATLLFIFSFILIVYNKTNYNQQFSVFINLIFSDKYFKLYNKLENISSRFNIFNFIIQLISLSFFILLIFNEYNIASKHNGTIYLQIITALLLLTLTKIILEKIISIIFEIENETTLFNHFRLSYKSLFSIFLLPINTLIYYNEVPKIIIILLIIILIIYNTITYLNILYINKSKLFDNLFYFILYICTLEIAPYYFIYYWIKNN